MKKSFRVKKYLKLTSRSACTHGFGSGSKGSRIARPNPASKPAPRFAAAITPGPAPVMIMCPSRTKSAAVSSARR